MRKLLTVLAMIGTFATPAIASDHSLARRPAVQNNRTALPQQGSESFAMTPKSGSAINSNSPEATGGGSLGYNEMLRFY
jgi:hypothetical protein